LERLPNMSKEIGTKLEAQQAMHQALAVVAKEKNLELIAKNPERPRLIGPCLERVFWVKESDRFPGDYDLWAKKIFTVDGRVARAVALVLRFDTGRFITAPSENPLAVYAAVVRHISDW
jgi:hypothetical protein